MYRPYVYGFFICFLFFAGRQLGWRSLLTFTFLAYGMAYACEYSATRNGFPFGVYTYLDGTRTRELWISNIPFWDSLSFVFLSYFSWIMASSLRCPPYPSRALLEWPTALLSGLLMMLLDVVIDPLTLLGDRWFLGKIYFYPQGGSYFGVTILNFLGWFFVGTITVFAFQRVALRQNLKWSPITGPTSWGVFGVYAGVFLFNWGVTAWIGEWSLFTASGLVIFVTLLPCAWILIRRAPVLA